MATNSARENLIKREYFAQFGIAEGLRRLAEDHPSGRSRSAGATHFQPPRSYRMNCSSIPRRLDSAYLASSAAGGQDASARTVQYHSQDIIPIHAKLKYTTLIEVPPSEKIMEAATGDKEFWVVDVVGNFCFVHPAKTGISSNLNLITDKGNIYSFTLQDVSDSSAVPDLKVLVQPVDRSSIVASSGPPQFVPAAQLEQSREQLAAVQSAYHAGGGRVQERLSLGPQVRLHVSPRTRRHSIFDPSITTTSSPTSRPTRLKSSACTK